MALSNFELPANLDGWLDKALLALTDELVSVRLGDTLLEKGSEGWLVNGQAANQDAATTYANRFKTLRVLGVFVGDEELESVGELHINDDVYLHISREIDEGEYVVGSPRVDEVFRLSTYIAEQLLMTDLEFAALEQEQAVPDES